MSEKIVRTFHNYLEKFFTSSDLSDVTVVAGSNEYKLHKVILAGRSLFFLKCFQFEKQSSQSSRVELLFENTTQFVGKVLEYIYTNTMVDPQTWGALFACAWQLQIDDLIQDLTDFFKKNLATDNASVFLRGAIPFREVVEAKTQAGQLDVFADCGKLIAKEFGTFVKQQQEDKKQQQQQNSPFDGWPVGVFVSILESVRDVDEDLILDQALAYLTRRTPPLDQQSARQVLEQVRYALLSKRQVLQRAQGSCVHQLSVCCHLARRMWYVSEFGQRRRRQELAGEASFSSTSCTFQIDIDIDHTDECGTKETTDCGF